MILRRLLGVLLSVALATFALAPPAVAADLITLTGTVTNTDGVSQEGTVCLELVGSGSCGGTYLVGGSWSWTWDEDENVAGDYLVRVISSTMDGTSRWYVAGDSSGTTTKALATPVHLAPGEPDFAFTMVMPAIAKVTGRVVNTSGVGVPGLPVLINEGGVVRSTFSGALGAYDLGYTRAGSWQVFVNPGAGYAGNQTGVVVPDFGSVVVADLVVQLPASISGVVTDSVSGLPLPFIEVYAWSAAAHNYLNSTTTDAAGRYLLGGLGGTPLVLRFTDAALNGYERTLNDGGDPVDWMPQTPLTLAEGEARVYDQALVPRAPTPPPVHNLAGVVTDQADQPLAGIDVTFGASTAVTDRLGRWFLDAADGTHLLEFAAGSGWAAAFPGESGWAAESFPGRLVSPVATPVTVSGGLGADDLDITLVRDVVNSAVPVVTGVAAAGRTLTATTGTWSVPPGTTYATAWLRDGGVVGTGASYLVKPADAGRTVRARVTATSGVSTAQASSAPRAVSRLATTTTVRGKSKHPGRVRIRVAVSAAGLVPTGTVVVRRGTKVVKRAVALAGGKAVIVLRGQPSGWKRYSVVFGGAGPTLPSTSPTIRVNVL